MQNIDIRGIAAAANLELDILAAHLFPTNEHPRRALDRMLREKTPLKEDQIVKLSVVSGVSIGELFTTGPWNVRLNERLHILTQGNYKAELDRETWVTTVYGPNSMEHKIILHNGATTLREYVALLDEYISTI